VHFTEQCTREIYDHRREVAADKMVIFAFSWGANQSRKLALFLQKYDKGTGRTIRSKPTKPTCSNTKIGVRYFGYDTIKNLFFLNS